MTIIVLVIIFAFLIMKDQEKDKRKTCKKEEAKVVARAVKNAWRT